MDWSSNLDLETNVVNLTYRKCKFDPISVKSNEDIKYVNAYFKHKITERELKDQSENGRKSTGSKYYASSEVIRYGISRGFVFSVHSGPEYLIKSWPKNS